MLEAGKENVFLKEKCEKCLQTIVEGKLQFLYENHFKGSTWNEYVLSLMRHLTHVNSLFSQAK